MSSNDSNDDDPEHQVVLTVVQDHTETIIVADILAAAIDESFIRVVEFGRAGRSPDRAVAIYWAGFSGNAVRTVSGQLLCSADERSCLVTLVDTPSCSELASSLDRVARIDRPVWRWQRLAEMADTGLALVERINRHAETNPLVTHIDRRALSAISAVSHARRQDCRVAHVA
jgi:hypothetical protein